MKAKFSNAWIGSKQPRKQRKYLANAPLHIRHKLMSAHLTKELRKKYGKRNFPVRKGDTVKVMRGEYKKKTGKIEQVNMGKLKILLEGVYKSKKDGTKVKIYFQPSNLLITELNTDDKKRTEALNRKFTVAKKIEVKKEDKKTETKKTEKKPVENKVKETKFKPLKPSSKQSFEGNK